MCPENERSIPTRKFEPEMKYYASSIVGTRKYQQDSYACIETPEGILAVICDGMGGLEGGERASGLAVRTLVEDYISGSIANIRKFLRNEAIRIDSMVTKLCDDNGRPLGAGTTMVAVYIDNGCMDWISVGDSKIYVIRNNTIQCIVREHNYRMMLNDMYMKGEITLEQYRSKEHKAEALISFLGIGSVSLIDESENSLQLMQGDIILLCSDGLYKSLSEQMILAVISDNYFDMQRAADELTDAALRYSSKSQDNTTVVLLHYV